MGGHRLPQCLAGNADLHAFRHERDYCLTDKAREAIVNWLEASRSDPNAKHPDERVVELPVLLKRAGDPRYMSEFGGLPVFLDTDTKADIDRLHDFRNRFSHHYDHSDLSWSCQTGRTAIAKFEALLTHSPSQREERPGSIGLIVQAHALRKAASGDPLPSRSQVICRAVRKAPSGRTAA